MEKIYELFKKYAKMMASQSYPAGDAAMLMLDTGDGVYATKYGANLADLKQEDVEKLAIKALPTSRSGMNAMVYSQTPYCQKALRDARPFKPMLDDMAMIIGKAAYIADGRDGNAKAGKSLKGALKKSTGCLVLRGVGSGSKGKGYTVTVGRNLYEAVVAMTVLEKSAEVLYLADKLGGAVFLNPMGVRRLHKKYKKSYSRSEQTARTAETASGIIGAPSAPAAQTETQTGEKSHEQILREKLTDLGKKLVRTGLVQGTWGNLSVRLDGQYMLVTPSGLDYMRLTPADMVKIDINSLRYEGKLKPTSEAGLHAEVYKNRSDIGAVVHTHSTYCSVFAAAEKAMPVDDPQLQEIFGTEVPLAAYAGAGTDKLAKNVADALGGSFGCIMSHHGMVACGETLEDAFDNSMAMEDYAGKYLGK